MSPCILEILSPAGFEGYFERLVALFAVGGAFDPAALEVVAGDHGIEVDLSSIPRLMHEYGLR